MSDTHYKTIWCFFGCALLGLWLLTAHFAFGYNSPFFSWSDAVSGFLLIVFSFLSLSGKRLWAPWALSLVGVWLQAAPLLFWAPAPSIYLNDTLIGALVLVFSIIIPGMPGQSEESGASIPPGWSYNPSSWPQRIPVVFLACAGWFISRYLAAFQLGYIDTVWDPFFKDGTLHVITSSISKDFPVSDAGLGALAYSIEAILALKGGERRWRTMPWMMVLFSLLVVPLGLVSITLILLQPLVVGAWCSLCLFTAFCMMVMIAIEIDEVAAVLQFLRSQRKSKKGFWTVFWKGNGSPKALLDVRTPRLDAPPRVLFPAMFWGVTLPKNLILSALLGIWLMIEPWVFQETGALAASDHILGALTIVVSVISMGEVIRKARFINAFFGSVVIISCLLFLLEPSTTLDVLQHSAIGIFLILLSLPKGKIKETYGF